MAEPVVETAQGRLRGRASATGHAYLGIPFAAPPLAALRLAPPQPPAPWTGERDATRAGPPPPQPTRPIAEFAHGALPPGDEDCLMLNVWTARPAAEPRPVLVWIHGGGWTMGWSATDIYDGALLAAAADVVVVTVGYRLGSLGWLCHPDLAAAPGAPAGNWGMLDQLAALRWVRENIAAFGGDPGRVTVGGQSAGAGCVVGLLVSPDADGLFSRALLHSPPLAESGNDPALGARWTEALTERLAGRPDDLGVLRTADAGAIVAAHEEMLSDGPFRGTRGGAWPTVDPVTLPVSPLDAPQARREVDVIVGTARDEATFLFRAAGRRPEPDAEQLRAMVGRLNGVTDPGAVVARHREEATAAGEPTDPNSQLIRIFTELQFTAPVARWARERAAAGGRVHHFRVDHRSPLPDLGALHTIDVPLLFGTFRTSATARRFADDTPDTRAVSEQMVERWGAFLHGGDPGWPAVAADDDPLLVLGGPDGRAHVEA
jgi:para-nitrobenzyl esterase